jgi:hypothetical protein
MRTFSRCSVCRLEGSTILKWGGGANYVLCGNHFLQFKAWGQVLVMIGTLRTGLGQ